VSGHADPGALADLVVGALPCAVVVADQDGQICYVNRAASELLGWSLAEVTSGDLPHVPPDLLAERAAILDRAAAGETVCVTTKRVHKDGRLVDLRADLVPVHDATGRHIATVITLRDVTQQLADAQGVQERQRLLEQLSDAVRDINVGLEMRPLLGRICRAVWTLLGAENTAFVLVEDDIGRVVAHYNGVPETLGLDIPVSGGAIGRAFETGRPVVIGDIHTVPVVRPDVLPILRHIHTVAVIPTSYRGVFNGAIYASFTEAGRPFTDNELDVLMLFAAHAGAAYANAADHDAVVRAQQRQRAVIDATADGMALVGADGLVLDWNAAAESLTGVPAHEAVGAPPPFPVAEVGAVVDHRLHSGRWLEIVTSRVGDTGETVLDFRDVTQTKRLEEARELFLATTSHELRTPITVVKGFAGTLLHRWDDLTDTERRAAVTTIVQRTESLAALVDQLLLGSTGPAAYEVKVAPFDMLAAVRASLAGVESLSIDHSIALDAQDCLPPALGDRSTIDVIVGQLLENAIKYSPDGGEITVSVRSADGFVAVRVSDQGIGLDPDDAELVFERFYQAPGGNRRRLGGVGLGLYIVRRLVEAQHGAVRAYGTPGVGTTVEFALPAADAVGVAPTDGEPAESRPPVARTDR
jgi:PAS domain S-box-containing protein